MKITKSVGVGCFANIFYHRVFQKSTKRKTDRGLTTLPVFLKGGSLVKKTNQQNVRYNYILLKKHTLSSYYLYRFLFFLCFLNAELTTETLSNI